MGLNGGHIEYINTFFNNENIDIMCLKEILFHERNLTELELLHENCDAKLR